MRNSTCKMGNNVKQANVPVGLVKITRMFVGNESLDEIIVPLLENQVDNLIDSIYHTTRANTVTSQANHTKGDELS